jgi:hypothetical protein
MPRRCCWNLLAILSFAATCVSGEDSKPSPEINPTRRQTIVQLMNRIKKAPQADVAQQAWQEIESLGVRPTDVKHVLELDRRLLYPDAAMRFHASQELARTPHEIRVVAVGNLRNLIAAERDPDLIWTHAVALSTIEPAAGSALELGQNSTHDPILHDAMHLESFREMPLELAQVEPGEPRQAVGQGGTFTGQFILQDGAERNDANRYIELYGGTASRPWEPAPPPPQRIPAHPLIAERQFDEILKQMDAGSEEAWQLYRWYGEDFPQTNTAKHHVARVFGSESKDRDLAFEAFWYSGSDAEFAAAVCYAVVRDLCIPHQVEMIDRIKNPEAYSLEVLKHIRLNQNPRVRLAVLEAFGRAPEIDDVLVETLRVSLSDDDLEIRHAALSAMIKSPNSIMRTEAGLKGFLLKETQVELLGAAATALKGDPWPAEFQRQVFGRIDPEKPAEFNLVLIDCLLDQTDPSSAAGKKLLQLQEEMQSLYIKQLEAYLVREIRWMIQESQGISQQSQMETLKQLNELKLLD